MITTSTMYPVDIQFRHRCPGGQHKRMVAKVVNHQLEFKCDSCGQMYYWDRAFLRLIMNALDSSTDFTFIFQ